MTSAEPKRSEIKGLTSIVKKVSMVRRFGNLDKLKRQETVDAEENRRLFEMPEGGSYHFKERLANIIARGGPQNSRKLIGVINEYGRRRRL